MLQKKIGDGLYAFSNVALAGLNDIDTATIISFLYILIFFTLKLPKLVYRYRQSVDLMSENKAVSDAAKAEIKQEIENSEKSENMND